VWDGCDSACGDGNREVHYNCWRMCENHIAVREHRAKKARDHSASIACISWKNVRTISGEQGDSPCHPIGATLYTTVPELINVYDVRDKLDNVPATQLCPHHRTLTPQAFRMSVQ
jgi:hypothetical protein